MPASPRVLFASAEAQPLVKTGGLGDVSGALPPALRELGVDARLLMPAYPGTVEQAGATPVTEALRTLPALEPVRVLRGTLPGTDTPVYLIEAPALYERPGGPYLDESGKDWPDNAFRFGVLAWMAAHFGMGDGVDGWLADLVHCNDWQTGLAPAYLAFGDHVHARSLISIHNLMFQGNFPAALLTRLALPSECFHPGGLEFYGTLSFLKAGIVYSDRITTVSPSYAREIQTVAFGFGMEGLLADRSNVLAGILNGIDTEVWDPGEDTLVPERYDSSSLTKKDVNKKALQARLGLDQDARRPLLGLVSRLTWQKGIDLIIDMLEDLLTEPIQFAMLGSGDKTYEHRMLELRDRHPAQVGVQLGYDESLAHLIEAGSDLFLMPSRFEPCGLNQMYSMRYGTPPVVNRVGGLADSVVDATPRTLDENSATGFVFDNPNAGELRASVLRTLLAYRDRSTWRRIQKAGMARDFSWRKSAQDYLAVYRSILDG